MSFAILVKYRRCQPFCQCQTSLTPQAPPLTTSDKHSQKGVLLSKQGNTLLEGGNELFYFKSGFLPLRKSKDTFGRLDKMVAPGRPGNRQNAICRAPDQSSAALSARLTHFVSAFLSEGRISPDR